jgi:hypothetical protein
MSQNTDTDFKFEVDVHNEVANPLRSGKEKLSKEASEKEQTRKKAEKRVRKRLRDLARMIYTNTDEMKRAEIEEQKEAAQKQRYKETNGADVQGKINKLEPKTEEPIENGLMLGEINIVHEKDRTLFKVLMKTQTRIDYTPRLKLSKKEQELLANIDAPSTSSLFYVNHAKDKIPLYRLGLTSRFVPFDYQRVQLNDFDNCELKTLLLAAQEADRRKEPMKTNVNSSFNRFMSSSQGIKHMFAFCEILAPDEYPVHWILKHPYKGTENESPRDNLDLNYYYSVSGGREETTPEGKEKRNRTICESKGHDLFEHQRFVTYCLRPYSPIRSLLVHSITGSGKTRMMQSVLENFAAYPNLKIVLFPKAEVRDTFYNKNVKLFTKYYNMNDGGDINRQFRLDSDGTPLYEYLDRFNRRFQGGDVMPNDDLYSFDSYQDRRNQKTHAGTTLVLTFREFADFTNATHRLQGSKALFKKNQLDLRGAMILVDEAHFLVATKATKIQKKVLSILEEHASSLHTIGLFTATPGPEIVKYANLLNVKKTCVTDANYIRLNHVMLFDRSMGNLQTGMFNRERWMYQDVERSILLTEREFTVNKKNEQKWKSEKNPRYAECWLTMTDWLRVKTNREKFKNHATYTSQKLRPDRYGSTIQLNDRLKQIRDWDESDISRKLGTSTAVTKWFKEVFFPGNMLKQDDLISDLKLMRGEKKDDDEFVKLDLLYPKLAAVLRNVLRTTYERKKNLEMIRSELHELQGLDNSKIELLEKRQQMEEEKRSVIMLSFDNGLGILSRILTKLNLSHVVSQVEDTTTRSYRPQTHPQIFVSKEDQETLGKKNVIIPSVDDSNNMSKGGFLKDTIVTSFYNDHADTIPIMLYNSLKPEGVDLFHSVYMHVIPTGKEFKSLEQMVGRINRLCHTTHADKEIMFYIFNQDDAERIDLGHKQEPLNHIRS